MSRFKGVYRSRLKISEDILPHARYGHKHHNLFDKRGCKFLNPASFLVLQRNRMGGKTSPYFSDELVTVHKAFFHNSPKLVFFQLPKKRIIWSMDAKDRASAWQRHQRCCLAWGYPALTCTVSACSSEPSTWFSPPHANQNVAEYKGSSCGGSHADCCCETRSGSPSSSRGGT